MPHFLFMPQNMNVETVQNLIKSSQNLSISGNQLVLTSFCFRLRGVHVGVDAVFWLRSIQALKDLAFFVLPWAIFEASISVKCIRYVERCRKNMREKDAVDSLWMVAKSWFIHVYVSCHLRCFIVTNTFQLVQDSFAHPPYDNIQYYIYFYISSSSYIYIHIYI